MEASGRSSWGSAVQVLCKTDCLNADLAFLLLALNRCNLLCVTLTRLCATAILTILKLEGYMGRQSKRWKVEYIFTGA